MKASELRIGTKILNDGKIETVSEVSNAGHVFTEESGFANIDKHIEPIPLTPEILEKAGFVFNENYDNYRIQINEYFYSIKQAEDKWYFSNDSSDASCYVITELLYFHELQNIIFAIEKKELEIKL